MRLLACALMLALVVPAASASADLGPIDLPDTSDWLDGICDDEHLRGREPWKTLCDTWEAGLDWIDLPDTSGWLDGICDDEHLRGREPWKTLCDTWESVVVSTT